jgi:GT2 family glycosyltransferase
MVHMAVVDITIVLATYNRAPMLRQALESLVRQETGGKFSYDILVIDDGSRDQTQEVVQEVANFSGVAITYVYQKNNGHCAALNTGIKRTRGEWLAFFDDDQWAEPGWLAELYRLAQEREVDCVGGAILIDLPESALLELGPRTRRLLAERIPGRKVKDAEIKEFIGSGNVLIRRAVFSRVGGFDPLFLRSYDTDIFWRMEKTGFRLGYAPQAIIHHVIPTSRLRPSYWRRLCFEQGVGSARIHYQYQGLLGLLLANFWRFGATLGRDLPLITIAACGRDRPLLLDSFCSLWYTISLIRGSLFFSCPRLFPQKKFIAAFGLHVPGEAR